MLRKQKYYGIILYVFYARLKEQGPLSCGQWCISTNISVVVSAYIGLVRLWGLGLAWTNCFYVLLWLSIKSSFFKLVSFELKECTTCLLVLLLYLSGKVWCGKCSLTMGKSSYLVFTGSPVWQWKSHGLNMIHIHTNIIASFFFFFFLLVWWNKIKRVKKKSNFLTVALVISVGILVFCISISTACVSELNTVSVGDFPWLTLWICSVQIRECYRYSWLVWEQIYLLVFNPLWAFFLQNKRV